MFLGDITWYILIDNLGNVAMSNNLIYLLTIWWWKLNKMCHCNKIFVFILFFTVNKSPYIFLTDSTKL